MIALFALFISISLAGAGPGNSMSVLNQPLADCSVGNEATTGFFRNGKCTDGADDSGSHHICVDLQYAETGDGDFCTLTGQPDWCKEKQNGKDRVHWCVCQWAFARFLEKADCSNFDVKCEATNMKALEAYRGDAKYSQALQCLESKCSTTLKKSAAAEYLNSTANFKTTKAEMWILQSLSPMN